MSDFNFTEQSTPEQKAAVDKIVGWLDNFDFNPKQKVMRMIGPAGSGKTTIMRQIAQKTKRRVRFAAFAGKAAMVLRSKGCEGAETLHKTFYEPRGASVKHYKEELAKLEGITNAAERVTQEALLAKLRKNMETPGFIRKLADEFEYGTAFCFDEVSMVDKFLGSDAESYGFPIVAVGDPNQLPPIQGTGYFFPPNFVPDIELKAVHRQKGDSPILRLADAVLANKTLPFGKLGDSEIVKGIPANRFLEFDQILCGTNKLRINVNTAIRKRQGRTKVMEPGEKLICLQNNYEVGVMNGSQWQVINCKPWTDTKGNVFYIAHIRSLDEPDVEITRALIHVNPLLEGHPKQDKYWTPMLSGVSTGLVMTYGYCITVHKSQGSQWGSVMVLDDWSGNSYREWLYTGITRAADRVTLARAQ